MSNTTNPTYPPVPMSTVMKAATQYKENPLILATCHSCIFDQAVFVGMCKHLRGSGIKEISMLQLWERVNDIIEKYRKNINMEMNSWNQFEEGISRLVSQGMIVRIDSKHSSNSIDGALFYPRLSHSDIEISLTQSKSVFANEVPSA